MDLELTGTVVPSRGEIVRGRRCQRHHGEGARRRAAQLSRVQRRPHRSRQPHALPRPAAPVAAGFAPDGRRVRAAGMRPRRFQIRQRHLRSRGGRPGAPVAAEGCDRAAARWTRQPAWAATSSPSSFPAYPIQTARRWWQIASSSRWRSPSRSTATRAPSGPASASRSIRGTDKPSKRSSALPTLRCTQARPPAGIARASPIPAGSKAGRRASTSSPGASAQDRDRHHRRATPGARCHGRTGGRGIRRRPGRAEIARVAGRARRVRARAFRRGRGADGSLRHRGPCDAQTGPSPVAAGCLESREYFPQLEHDDHRGLSARVAASPCRFGRQGTRAAAVGQGVFRRRVEWQFFFLFAFSPSSLAAPFAETRSFTLLPLCVKYSLFFYLFTFFLLYFSISRSRITERLALSFADLLFFFTSSYRRCTF